MKLSRLFLCLLVFCTIWQVNAQDFSNKGKDFWLGYGNHIRYITGNPINAQNLILYFTSDQNANVTVEIPGLNYTQTYQVVANQVTVSMPLPKTSPQDARLTGPGKFNTGIHIISDKAIVAYAHIYNASVSGASLLFPTNTLGKEYYSVNYTQRSNETNSSSFFFIVATEDNTNIEITPSAANMNGLTVGVASQPITLNKGEIYNVMGTTSGTTGTDLTGSKIRSLSSGNSICKPIAVFSGSGKISIGGTGTGSADNLFAQAFPANAWGRKYLTAPTGSQPNNFYRVCVKDPTTEVKLNGVILPTSSLINGFYYEFKNSGGISSPNPNLIEANQPVLVAQYCTTQGFEGNPNTTPGGDPEMIYLSPVEQTINKITLYSTSQFLILRNYINIIIKKEGVASFKLDGLPPLPTDFLPHPGDPNYSYAILQVSSGSHTLYSDSGFNAIAYGFGSAESYGYNAGTNIVDLNPPVSISNEFSASNISYSATCSNTPFKINLALTYKPTKIVIDFNGTTALSSGTSPFTYLVSATGNGYDSTYISNGKTYYLYRVPQTFKFNVAGTYPVKIVNTTTLPQSDGCSNTNEQEITDNVVVNAPPTADFSVSTNNCVTSPVGFTDLSDGLGRPIVRWIWDFGDGTTDIIQNPTKTFSSANNYTAKLTSITDYGCISTITKPINLSAKPIASFTVPTIRCENKNIVFTDASTIASGPASNTINRYTWNLDNGSATDTLTANTSRTTSYSIWGNKNPFLLIESNTGCVSDTFRLPTPFIINPIPKVGFVIPDVCLADANAPFQDTTKIADGSEAQFVYSWKFNDGSPAISPGPSFSTSTFKNPAPKYNTVGNYFVQLRVTSNNGCIDSLRSSFTVNGSIPNPNFIVQLANPLCSNDSIRIINTSTVDFGNTTRIDVFWDTINKPFIFYKDDNPKIGGGDIYSNLYTNFSSPDSIYFGVKLLAYSGNSSVCRKSIRKIIAVKNSPKVTFTDIRDICYDAVPRQITQGSFVSALSATATYSGKGINASGLLNPVTTGVGKDTLKYFVQNTAGCKDSAFQPLEVWPSPIAKWGISSPLCEKNDIAFTDSSVANYSNIVSRKWIFGDNTTQTINTTAFTKKYDTTKIYLTSLQVTTDSGCISNINQQSVDVRPLPIIKYSLPSICLPDGRGTFTNQSFIVDNSEALFSYSWNFGDINDPSSSTLREPTHKYTALGPNTIKLKITTKNGCVDSLSKVLTTIYPWPKASFSVNPINICLGDTIQFTDLGNGMTSAAVSWNWNLAGGFTSTLQNPKRRFNDSGTFNISYYFFNAQGCVSDTVNKDVIVYPYPILTLGPKINVLEGGSAKIKPKYVYGNNLTYLWTPPTYLNNDTDSIPVTTPLGDITYRLNLTGIGGCIVTDTIFIKLLLAPIVPNAFTPNGDGINDRWRIQYLESYPGATVDVYNRYGQAVFSSEGYDVDWDGTVNGKALPIGTYYYVINPKNGRKIIAGSITIIR